MATVLEEKRSPNQSSNDDKKRPVTRSTVITSEPIIPAGVEVSRLEELNGNKVIFLVDDSGTNQWAFDFAIKTAKNFSAKLVLTYLIEDEKVPEAYIEFANAEGVSGYEAEYYNWLAESKLASLGGKAEAAGVEWTTEFHFGNIKKATKFYTSDKSAIVIVNRSNETSAIRRFLNRLFSREAPKLDAEVIGV